MSMKNAIIHNLLFDFDGTLADSSPLHVQAMAETLSAERRDLLPDFDYEPLKGLTSKETFLKLGICEAPQLNRCIKAKQQRYRQLLSEDRLSLLPGARSALKVAQANKHHLFLVTSGSAGSVSLALEKLGIAGCFEAIVTSDDVPRGKPSPDPYRFCIEKFGLMPVQSVAIEDAASGVISAQGAGLRVIGVNNPKIQPLVNQFFLNMNLFAEALGEGRPEDIQA